MNADKFVVRGQTYDVLSPATFGDYIETVGAACINPSGYAENKLFLAYDDNVQKLFRATAAIAYSELLIKETNCEPTTMAEALANALSAGGVSYDNTDSGLTASNVQDAIDEVNGDVETVNSALTNLTTNAASQKNYCPSKNYYSVGVEGVTWEPTKAAVLVNDMRTDLGTTDHYGLICVNNGMKYTGYYEYLVGGNNRYIKINFGSYAQSTSYTIVENAGTVTVDIVVDSNRIANNLTTSYEGFVLDARQGKALFDGKLQCFAKLISGTTFDDFCANLMEEVNTSGNGFYYGAWNEHNNYFAIFYRYGSYYIKGIMHYGFANSAVVYSLSRTPTEISIKQLQFVS